MVDQQKIGAGTAHSGGVEDNEDVADGRGAADDGGAVDS